MSVLDLDDAKTYLSLKLDVTTYDAEVQAIIDAAEAVLAERVGPLEPTDVTVRVRGGAVLILPVSPVIEFESITPLGESALTSDDLFLDPTAGLIAYGVSGDVFSSTAYDVSYTAGRETCPADLLLAIKELVRHLWQTQRGPARVNSPGTESPAVPAGNYLLPKRVSELIAPHLQTRVA